MEILFCAILNVISAHVIGVHVYQSLCVKAYSIEMLY